MEKEIKDMLANAQVNKDDVIKHMKENFSCEELANMTNILSLYQPLLQAAHGLNTEILKMSTTGQVTVPVECLTVMSNWNKEYSRLNTRLEIFNKNETMH